MARNMGRIMVMLETQNEHGEVGSASYIEGQPQFAKTVDAQRYIRDQLSPQDLEDGQTYAVYRRIGGGRPVVKTEVILAWEAS